MELASDISNITISKQLCGMKEFTAPHTPRKQYILDDDSIYINFLKMETNLK